MSKPLITIVAQKVVVHEGCVSGHEVWILIERRGRTGQKKVWSNDSAFTADAVKHAHALAAGVKLGGRTVAVDMSRGPRHVSRCAMCGQDGPLKGFMKKHRCPKKKGSKS